MEEIKVEIKGFDFILNNFRSVYWPENEILAISDLHLGKSGHFRKNGIAIPSTISDKDISNLADLLSHYQPKIFMVIGDFVHAGFNQEWKAFLTIKSKFPETKFILVKGNHDRGKDEVFQEAGMDLVCRDYSVGEFMFVHEFNANIDSFQICGHIHPGISLKLLNRKKEKLPAFVLTNDQLILPAFSQFTGLSIQKQLENQSYFVFNEKTILKI